MRDGKFCFLTPTSEKNEKQQQEGGHGESSLGHAMNILSAKCCSTTKFPGVFVANRGTDTRLANIHGVGACEPGWRTISTMSFEKNVEEGT